MSGSPPTDGATVQAALFDAIAETASQQEIDAAAAELSQTLGDPGTLLDLGFVPSDVAAANGYDCVTDGGVSAAPVCVTAKVIHRSLRDTSARDVGADDT